MATLTAPNLGIYYGWTLGESNWDDEMSANLKKLDALIHLSVLDKGLGTPPGSPTDGDRYIVPAGATGAWSGQTNKIAVRVAGTWEFYTPAVGWNAWVADEALQYTFNGSTWVTLVASQPYDVHVTFNGRPDSGITLARVLIPRTTTFPSGLTGSYAKSEIAATASTSFGITKEGSSIGAINWGVGASSATFTFATQQVFAAGEMLEIIAPGVSDVTLADLAMTLVGWR